MTELERKYILTNDALCYSLMWKKEFKKQLLLDKDTDFDSENQKQEYIKEVEKFVLNLKCALNKAYDLNL